MCLFSFTNEQTQAETPVFVFSLRQEEEKSWAQQSYFGYSFEAYSTTDDKTKSSKTASDKAKKKKRPADIAVNTNVQWCCVVKGKIGNVRLYMGGEVDCVDGQFKSSLLASSLMPFSGEWQKDMIQCVELKTNMVMESHRQRFNFERCESVLDSKGRIWLISDGIFPQWQKTHETLGTELSSWSTGESSVPSALSPV